MTKNTIYTAEEYMAQGFTAEEVPLITYFDILHNTLCDMTKEERESEEVQPIWERYERLVKILKL